MRASTPTGLATHIAEVIARTGLDPVHLRLEITETVLVEESASALASLESLNVISTKFNDDWIAPIGQIKTLKKLSFTNNGKLTDAGMEKLAGLTNLESFNFVGTQITGRAYAKFIGWNKCVRVSHRGSSIDDEGLKELCDHLPNLESISLAHAKFTDAGAPTWPS